jgi:hypothetical protein
MRSTTRWLVAASLAVTLGLGIVGPATAADPTATPAPAWTCRASVGYINLVGNGTSGHIEPIVANGDAFTGLDNDFCQGANAGFPDLTLGSDPAQGQAVETAPTARTTIKADLTYKQTPAGAAGVEHLILMGNGHAISADVLSASASGACKDGAPVLKGSSSVANLVIDGHAIADPGTQQTVVDNPPNLVVTVDEQIPAAPMKGSPGVGDGKELIQRTLHVLIGQNATNYIEFVIGEARAGYRGDPSKLCAPPPSCPEGTTLDAASGLCVAPARVAAPAPVPPCPDGSTRDANGACLVVLSEKVRSGTAQLFGRTGCASNAFRARVFGTSIAKVVYSIDGRRVATLTHPTGGGVFGIKVNPRNYRYGIHRVLAQVTFTPESQTAPRTLVLNFQHCAPVLARPQFTG